MLHTNTPNISPVARNKRATSDSFSPLNYLFYEVTDFITALVCQCIYFSAAARHSLITAPHLALNSPFLPGI